MVSLSGEYSDCCKYIDRLIDLQSHVGTLEPRYTKAIVEIIVIRLFDIITESIISVAAKIACGAVYVDGSYPLLLLRAKSRDAALSNMLSVGRSKSIKFLHWTEAGRIKENVKYVIGQSDDFIKTLDSHSIFFSEMRIVRNRIAHNNATSRKHYRKVVLRYYGAELNTVSPGMLLLSPRQKPLIIEQYLHKSKVLIKALVKA